MSEMANSGKAHLASLLKKEIEAGDGIALMGFGVGEAWWGSPQAEIAQANVEEEIPTTYPIDWSKSVTITSTDGLTTFNATQDYRVGTDGKCYLTSESAISVWDDVRVSYTAKVPDPAKTDTTITGLVGFIRIFAIDFVELLSETEQENPIIISAGSEDYAASVTPKRHLLTRATLREDDAIGADIKAYGIFIGCQIAEGLPSGQVFFTPEQVTELGALYLTKTRAPVPHDGTVALSTTAVMEI